MTDKDRRRDGDECPERDYDGYCHCKRDQHPRLESLRTDCYPLRERS